MRQIVSFALANGVLPIECKTSPDKVQIWEFGLKLSRRGEFSIYRNDALQAEYCPGIQIEEARWLP